jgi:hypothetical protein
MPLPEPPEAGSERNGKAVGRDIVERKGKNATPNKQTINLAVLGDPEAAKECKEANLCAPCPYCGSYDCIEFSEALYGNETQSVYGISNKCNSCGKVTDGPNAGWRYLPDLRAVAKEVYAPKWLPFDAENPPKTDCIVYHDSRKEVMFAYREGWEWEWVKDDWEKHVTHYMPLPEPPEEGSA